MCCTNRVVWVLEIALLQLGCALVDYWDVCAVQHPIADIAAQTAAALALSAKVLNDFGEAGEERAADRWWKKAKAAYEYAKKMTAMHGERATCTSSTASKNCVGVGCPKMGGIQGVRTRHRMHYIAPCTCQEYMLAKPRLKPWPVYQSERVLRAHLYSYGTETAIICSLCCSTY
jgi:hypothetical protein